MNIKNIINILLRRRRFLAVFVLRERETFHIVGKKYIRVNTHTVRFHGGKYPVDVSFPTYTKKSKNVYFLDVKMLKQILINSDDPKALREILPLELDGTDSKFNLITPELLDAITKVSLLRALFSSIMTGKSGLAMGIIVGAIAGVGVGWVIRDVITGGYF